MERRGNGDLLADSAGPRLVDRVCMAFCKTTRLETAPVAPATRASIMSFSRATARWPARLNGSCDSRTQRQARVLALLLVPQTRGCARFPCGGFDAGHSKRVCDTNSFDHRPGRQERELFAALRVLKRARRKTGLMARLRCVVAAQICARVG